MQEEHNLETMLRILKGFMTDMETDLSAFWNQITSKMQKQSQILQMKVFRKQLLYSKPFAILQVSLRSCFCTNSSVTVKG